MAFHGNTSPTTEKHVVTIHFFLSRRTERKHSLSQRGLQQLGHSGTVERKPHHGCEDQIQDMCVLSRKGTLSPKERNFCSYEIQWPAVSKSFHSFWQLFHEACPNTFVTIFFTSHAAIAYFKQHLYINYLSYLSGFFPGWFNVPNKCISLLKANTILHALSLSLLGLLGSVTCQVHSKHAVNNYQIGM